MVFKTFGWSFALTIVASILGYLYAGVAGLSTVLILCVLEISLSFDNAVVNATVLVKMSAYWRRIFLTVGLLIAVFGMRLLFPLLVVTATSQISPMHAIALALEHGDSTVPGTYGYILNAAHPAIAAFGGTFLFMLFLNFVFEDREVRWLQWIEVQLARIGRLESAPAVVALAALICAAQFLAGDANRANVYLAGVAGIAGYLVISGIGELLEDSQANSDDPDEAPSSTPVSGKAALFLFLYLEVLDASFSFDGVIGAFAITADPILIALGLGVGALYVRSLTIFLVKKGVLRDYVYLEHGALWAVGALAIVLLLSIKWQIPEAVTGLLGIVFIGAGFVSSIVHSRRQGSGELAASS